MKKLALILLGILIGIAGSYLLNSESNTHQDKAPTPKPVASPEPKLETPKGLISVDKAKAMSKAYDARYNLINKAYFSETDGDNRSVWFSLSDIENYIAYAQNKADSSGLSKNSITGLRIYLAAYTNNEPNPKVPGQTTVFIVPTVDNSISKGGAPFSTVIQTMRDFTKADALNMGNTGNPPPATYPQ